jgi:hypothetical protein
MDERRPDEIVAILPPGKVSKNLSTCPDNSVAGQVDRSVTRSRPRRHLAFADSQRARHRRGNWCSNSERAGDPLFHKLLRRTLRE